MENQPSGKTAHMLIHREDRLYLEENISLLYQGLQSFRNMRRIDASLRKARDSPNPWPVGAVPARIGRSPHAVDKADELLHASGTGLDMDAVGPEVDLVLGGEIASRNGLLESRSTMRDSADMRVA
jgi:hypothetical protein